MESHRILLPRKANDHILWKQHYFITSLGVQSGEWYYCIALRSMSGNMWRKTAKCLILAHSAALCQILWWVSMYQAANDSMEWCCLPTFQPQVKYAEIPLILPDSQTPWKQSSKKEFQAIVRWFVFVQAPVLDVLMHADVHILYKSKYIYI